MSSNPKLFWGEEPHAASGQLRAGTTKSSDPRFVIRATRFHQGTRDDRIAVVRELLDSTDPLPIVARMAAFLAGYCGVETAAEFCEIVEELHHAVETPDQAD